MTRSYVWPQDLKKQHSKVLQEMVMDIMRALSSANLDIRQKTLDITLDLIAPKSIAEVMQAPLIASTSTRSQTNYV